MRNEKGAISIFVLIAMLFFLAFIMVSYDNVQEKGRTQQKTTELLTDLYDTHEDINAVYSKIYSNTTVNLNSVVKTEAQNAVVNTANYIAIDGTVYKRAN